MRSDHAGFPAHQVPVCRRASSPLGTVGAVAAVLALVTGCGGGSAAPAPAPSSAPSSARSSVAASATPSGTPSSTIPVTPSPSGSGTPSGTAAPDASCPGKVPASEGLDPFYGRYCDVLGIPLVAHRDVEPLALRTAAAYLREMLAHRPDLAAALADSTVRVGLIGRDQRTTQMPEWSDLNEVFPDTDWDERARGLGATAERPLVGAGEENVLCLPEDRYLGESILVHELAHTVLEFGAQTVDPGFRARVERAYDRAMAAGRWDGTYAATNADEYWAEAAQSFFDTNLSDDFQHNAVDTRAELRRYDKAVYRLLVEVFGERDWRPACP